MTLRALFAAGITAVAVSLAACGPSATEGRTAFEAADDRAKGSPDAPVTIIEYASVACGGCAAFHEAAMPTIDEYIDNGDVRMVFREMITGPSELAFAGFLLANCAPEDQYFDVIDILFEQQRAMFTAMQQGRAQQQLLTIARAAGFSNEEFRQCLSDEEGLEAIQARNQAAVDAGIGGTPAFIVNGDLLEAIRDGQGALVYSANGEVLADDQGPIPATFEGETFSRIIAYYKARVEGGAGDGGAG